ncbi:MAG: hypothetical protein N2203_07370, partial [Bacteroidia bacterium]|nr:hypothetical protein [Bacteroidia bacterium]
AIPTTQNEKNSNLVIFASNNASLLPANKIHLVQTEELINTSEKNILSFLNAKANYHWRKDYLFFIQHWWR